jgi:hypothetical protein
MIERNIVRNCECKLKLPNKNICNENRVITQLKISKLKYGGSGMM